MLQVVSVDNKTISRLYDPTHRFFFFNMNYAINECSFKNKMIFVSIVGQGLTITNVNIANTTVLLTVVSSYDVICIIQVHIFVILVVLTFDIAPSDINSKELPIYKMTRTPYLTNKLYFWVDFPCSIRTTGGCI